MESVKISVCIPTYNQSQYIERTIRSAAEQTVKPYEIIVSDDCSTDNTFSVLEQLQSEIKNLKVVRQPVNLGIAKNNDYCLRLAKGKYIVRLDSDDYLSPVFTEKLLQALEQQPDAGYAHAAVQEIDQNGEFTRVRRLSRSSGYINGDDALRAAINGYKVAANIIMYRREALEKAGFIKATVNFAEDYFLSASIAAVGYGNVYCNEILSYYRVWSDAGKVRQKRKLTEIQGLRMVFNEVLEPAFELRQWSKAKLKKSRKDFACNQADCLGWSIYNATEKKELKDALFELSADKPVKVYTWMYTNGYGSLLQFTKSFLTLPKKFAKKLSK